MQRIISVAAVLSLVVAALIWANVLITGRSARVPVIATSPTTPSLSPPTKATSRATSTPSLASCTLTPKQVYQRIFDLPGWNGGVAYSNGQIDLRIYHLSMLGCYLVAEVEIENLSDAVVHVNPLDFSGVDAQRKMCEVPTYHFGRDEALRAIDVYPGTRTSGTMYFDFCSRSYPASIIYDSFHAPPLIIDLGEVVGCY